MTVLLPALNASNHIRTAVRSTLRGLPRDAELFVLDDGSTDNTAEVAVKAGTRRGVVDPRLKVVSRPPSGGLGKALNWMLEETDSQLVSRMDADDINLPWRFSTSYQALKSGIDVVFSQMMLNRGKVIIPGVPSAISPRAFPVHLLLRNPASHPTIVARREAFTVSGGYRDVPAEDYDLWMRMASHGLAMRRLALNSYVYRSHPQQSTASPDWYRKSWSNPLQAEAFADLSETITGVRLKRLVAIAQLPPDDKEPQLQQFDQLVGAAIAELPRASQPVLRRRLNRRIEWARQYSTND
ncbi:glycosyltransferase family 2 protein [Corynebacterium atrinae]|uniref:glycosyltransferase family 2 protein n=1 Tax=Corynebacterium atrinae TaxID=1336740 RepID=UPI0025B2BE7A|nr:glycosyltransferase family 2 protein [Corynebacterium atrinae]